MDMGFGINESDRDEEPIIKAYLEAVKEYNEKVDRGEIVPTAPEDRELVWMESKTGSVLYIDGHDTKLRKKYGRLTVKNPEFLIGRGSCY